MNRVDEWQRLVEALDAWSSASEIAPGQLEVSLPGTDRRVVIVMTPGQWADMVGVMWGSFEDALDDVQLTLQELQPDEGFAVYAQYRLVGSTEPALNQQARPTPDPGGAWVAYDRKGRVASRFADWTEPD